MKLSSAEQAELDRMFELHFGVKLPKEIHVTTRLCKGLSSRSETLTTKETFELLFGTKLACSELYAVQLCDEWIDKVTNYLLSAELARKEREKK